jgi:hypothetical protein
MERFEIVITAEAEVIPGSDPDEHEPEAIEE